MDIKIYGVENLEKWLQERMDKVQNIGQLKDDIGILIKEDIDNNFEKESSPSGKKWEEWSESTEEYRRKRGRDDGKILNFDNHLRGSVDYETTNYSIKAGALKGPKYSRIHQMGGYAGRGLKTYIPARPYVGLSIVMNKKIRRLVEERT